MCWQDMKRSGIYHKLENISRLAIMKEIKVNCNSIISDEERRLISFASEDIEDYEINDSELILKLNDNADEEVVNKNIIKILKGKSDNKDEVKIIKEKQRDLIYTLDEEIFKSGIIKRESKGCISLSKLGILLFDFFDEFFLSIIKDETYEMRQFPTLLNTDVLNSTNYISTSPQYIMFCSRVKETVSEYENLQKKYFTKKINTSLSYPTYALSPSACFHLYQSIKGKKIKGNSIFTLKQNVFRNEGRFNWGEIERLQDYHVREIVMIGNHDYVVDKREMFINKSMELLEKLKMNYAISVACDPFIMPVMQRYKDIQMKNRVKYELRLNVSDKKTIACGSFNLHGTAFSNRFKFEVENCDITESGCIGFGIERLIIAFLKQYGTEISRWPNIVKDYINCKEK